ncbi:MAG: hypothetical protein JXQ29_10790 [Planctomycetes bacterium]|nr:hypothetical protein [Planctomycetota bacterium]
MRALGGFGIVLLISVWAAAQTLPFRTHGDFYVVDQDLDGVLRFQDLDGDGDVQDAGEQIVFYDSTSPGPDLSNPQAITIHPFDGSVWISDTSLDVVLRLVDRNGDGDANDAGEYSIFYDATGAVAISSVLALSFDEQGILFLLNSGTPDNVIRLEDKNKDGDALDPGEATVFFDNTAVTGPWLQSPADMIFFQGHLYIGDNTITPKHIVRIRDLNHDGDALDAGEAVRWADPTAGGGSFVWNLIFELKGPALFGVCITTGNVYRWQDLNKDGDALDPGEVVTFFDSANNASSVSLKTSFTLTTDPLGSLYVCNHTADVIYRLTDLNADLDANDAGEVVAYFSNTGTPTPAVLLGRARDCIIGPAGEVTPGMVSPAIGKTADFLLDDPIGGGCFYAAALSYSSTGIPLGSPDIRVVPLGLDPLLVVSANVALPIFIGFQGTLSGPGQAVAKLAVPALPALVSLRLHMAFVTVRPGAPSGILTVSRPYSFVIGG